jgi:2-aminophenol/2-amino-5-chlorophenol 1,6-dioxygenase alpha subunit
MSTINAYIVPGLPHILLGADQNAGWAALKSAYEAIGREIEASGAELLLVYSTQWFSVIGHLMQTDPNPEWVLVDQNWYELGEIPYSFRIDPEFGKLYAATAKQQGMQAATVNYHGFPIDTGTVVALKLLNPNNRIPASVVSCNIYSERDETRALGLAARSAIERYGKKTVVVLVSNLSNRFEIAEIDPAHDRISSAKDDEWNRKILEMLGEGRLEDVAQVAREFGREANADMGFKGIWWLGSVMGEHNRYDGKVWAYAPVWGTGNAIVELTPSSKQLDFEKEFDEGPAGGAATPSASDGGGTGLESHNVLADGPRVHSASEMSSQREVSAEDDLAERGDWAPAAASGSTRPEMAEAPASKQTVAAGIVTTDKAAKPVGPYPHARRVGELLFLSGIGPRRAGTNEIPGLTRDAAGNITAHDIDVQTRAVIDNLRAVLEEAGSSLENILDVTVYLTDMKRDFAEFNRVYAEYFTDIQPTRTTVGVDSLPTPIAVEMKVIAAVGTAR